jgi:hypothetical protein
VVTSACISLDPCADAEEAEARAVLPGLKFCSNLRSTKVIMELDSLNTVHALKYNHTTTAGSSEKGDEVLKNPPSLNLQAIGIARLNLQEQEHDISDEEVHAAISQLPAGKAPGSDGFSALFFKHCWQIIKVDIMRAIRALECRTSRNLHLLNSATLILLPKTPDAAHPKEFRPISLVHFFAKLFTKILAIRLRPRMHELVLPCQSAFIQNRSIHDNFVFVRAQTKLFKQKKMPALLLKLDLQKAFDSISWEFLLEVLEAKGFGGKWRDWIACLFLSASTRIVVNGELTERFFHKRGLRQGDPLSPLLFTIATDVLAHLFALADRERILKSNKLLQPNHRISLYADDVVIFTEPDTHELASIRLLLQSFGEASGLLTNFQKSSIIPIQCKDIDLAPLSAAMECPTQTFPCTYLGLPLSDKRLRKEDLQPTLDKLAAKVKGWNKGQFSLDARLLLVKHVLSAMHIHQLLVLDPPIWLTKAIDRLRRGFLWNQDEIAAGGRCLVQWSTVCRPLQFGGLGITDLQRKGVALRARWLWQRWNNTDKPWVDLPLISDGRSRALFNSATNFIIGDGQKTSFWRDPWLNGRCIADIAPDLFKCCTLRNISVGQALTGLKWMRHFRRNIPPAALQQFLLLHNSLTAIQLHPGVQDAITWRWSNDGKYSASSAYDMQFEGSQRFSFVTTVWKSEATLKCRLFAWLALLGKCNTADCLERKGAPHNAACVLCLSSPENPIHLLATCNVTISIWRQITSRANLPATLLPNAGTRSLQVWALNTKKSLPRPQRKPWISLVHLTWWNIWKERNRRIFQNQAQPLRKIVDNIIAEAMLWREAGRSTTCDLLCRPREPD